MGLPLTTEPLDPSPPGRGRLPDPSRGVRAARPGPGRARAGGPAPGVGGGPGRRRLGPRRHGSGLAQAGGRRHRRRSGPGRARRTRPGRGRLAALPGGDTVAAAFGAIAERRQVRFTYRGEARLVDPWRLSFRRGQWYLAGLRPRSRRGASVPARPHRRAVVPDGPPGAFARPPGGEAAPPPAWRLGDDDEITAELLVDADQARWAPKPSGRKRWRPGVRTVRSSSGWA